MSNNLFRQAEIDAELNAAAQEEFGTKFNISTVYVDEPNQVNTDSDNTDSDSTEATPTVSMRIVTLVNL